MLPSLSTSVFFPGGPPALRGAFGPLASVSRRPGLGSSGNAPPLGVCPSSGRREGWRDVAFVGEVVSLAGRILGNTFSVEFGGSPSLTACFC